MAESPPRGPLVDRFEALVAWFVSNSDADADTMRRRRLLIAAALLLVPVCLVMFVVSSLVGDPVMAGNRFALLSTAALFALVPFVVRWTGRADVAGAALVAIGCGALFFFERNTEVMYPAWIWRPTIPIVASYFLGTRAAIGFAEPLTNTVL